ncbi:YegS/Rv2252/BmrU family lipid kinase [Bacillus spizizenii]|uniref:YegS/Rv2252/BmrU family lipid kinase n=1 Tax=Bacillus spizizenii TaxID=96241 RepID=UPI0005C8E031|nr:YegS/Rv2252/BmrU family lipid kinase [Bacillus spizizenii]MCY7762408.1 YegS/Rv2252/BmrU family lipid kinase [Bacillus spizizenii]MCY7797057.1 YegS/Rv2252/BmrU family lipid kinase [Bacillus spizizenii]MCY7802581.1 YegS/Rv2252/BmrU family lipid kinase [Bacillus spizizenii]MCY7898335.1 YegS/Rv2252/BmrU family lipid kinase [Bacillus spizizenii]MCY7972178.1 YegS/Rv2252/BmrU family lipid kinase [Bacillus spizizenii]
MSHRKALLIHNGNAGNKHIEKALGAVVPVLSQALDEVIVRQTKKKDDAYYFCQSIDDSVDTVFILGGDGTVHQCINGISALERKPAVGILPGGTCNDFSRVLGIPQNLAKAAEALVSGKKTSVDVCQMNERYFLNFWGIGLITETSNQINETSKAILGKISYYTSALRTVSSAGSFPMTLKIDGKEIKEEAVMLLVMNGQYIGTNRIPLPDASIDDGLLDILICRSTNLSALRELMSMEQGTIDRFTGELSYIQASRVEIETDTVKKVDTDGEIYTHTPAVIQVLPRHIDMLVP